MKNHLIKKFVIVDQMTLNILLKDIKIFIIKEKRIMKTMPIKITGINDMTNFVKAAAFVWS